MKQFRVIRFSEWVKMHYWNRNFANPNLEPVWQNLYDHDDRRSHDEVRAEFFSGRYYLVDVAEERKAKEQWDIHLRSSMDAYKYGPNGA